MKHILLIVSILLIHFSGFSQEILGNSSDWNNYSNIENEKNQLELKIFPNPCKDKKITVELNMDYLSEIRLINITGKEILLNKIDVPVSKHQLELSNIPNGIYLIQVKTTENKIVAKKLLVSGN